MERRPRNESSSPTILPSIAADIHDKERYLDHIKTVTYAPTKGSAYSRLDRGRYRKEIPHVRKELAQLRLAESFVKKNAVPGTVKLEPTVATSLLADVAYFIADNRMYLQQNGADTRAMHHASNFSSEGDVWHGDMLTAIPGATNVVVVQRFCGSPNCVEYYLTAADNVTIAD